MATPGEIVREGISAVADPSSFLQTRTAFGDLVGGVNDLANQFSRTDTTLPSRFLTSHGYSVYGMSATGPIALGAVFGVTSSQGQTLTDRTEINAVSVGLPNSVVRGHITSRTLSIRAFALSDKLFLAAFGRPANFGLLSVLPSFAFVEDDINPYGALRNRIAYTGVIFENLNTARAADDDRLVRLDVTARWTGMVILK